MIRICRLAGALALGALVAVLCLAPPAAKAQGTYQRNANGAPYTALLGCDGLTPAGPANPPCAVQPFAALSPSVSLSAGTSSTRAALTAAGAVIEITNSGSVPAYVALGGSGVTATTSGVPIPAGATMPLAVGSNAYIAAITASGTAPLLVTSGNGTPFSFGGGGNGQVTIADGGDATQGAKADIACDAEPCSIKGTLAQIRLDQDALAGAISTARAVLLDNVTDGQVITGSVVTSATTAVQFPSGQGYGYVILGFDQVGTSNTITVQASIDGTNYNWPVVCWRGDTTSSAPGATITPSTAQIYLCPLLGQNERAQVTTYTTGNVQAYVIAKRGLPPIPTAIGVTATGPAADGSAPSGNPVEVACSVLTGVQAYATPAAKRLVCGKNGGLSVQEVARTPYFWSGSGTSNFVTGAGFIHNVVVTTPIAGETITIYDNTAGSGTLLLPTTTVPATAGNPFWLPIDEPFATGLTIVITGGTGSGGIVSYNQ